MDSKSDKDVPMEKKGGKSGRDSRPVRNSVERSPNLIGEEDFDLESDEDLIELSKQRISLLFQPKKNH